MIVINMIVPGHGRRLMSADATNLSRDHVARAALSRQRLNPLQSALRPGQVPGFFVGVMPESMSAFGT